MTFYYVESNSLEEYKHWVEIFRSYGYDWCFGRESVDFIIGNGSCYLCIDDSSKHITWTCTLSCNMGNIDPFFMIPISKHFIGRRLKLERILDEDK